MVRTGRPAVLTGAARALVAWVLGLLLALGAVVLGPGAAPAAAAANDLVCGNGYLYGVASGSANLQRINSATGAASTIGAFGSGGASINALGIDAPGNRAYVMQAATNGTATMYVYNDATGAAAGSFTVSGFHTGLATFLAGAVDPTTGRYWVGGMVNSTFYAYSINPATGTLDTPRFTSPAGNFNADMAFDGKGNLYVAFSPAGAQGTLRRYDSGSLTGSQAGTQLNAVPAATSGYPGVAFASDGYLYMTTSGTLRRVSPTDGAQVGGAISVAPATTFSDLGSCATPTVVDAVRKDVVSRRAAGDQFRISLTGNGASAAATTTGSGTGVQATTGPVVVLPSQPYAVAETAAGTTNLADYLSTYRCVDTNTGTVVTSGSGTSLTLTTPATGSDGKGANITCTFTNEAKNARIQLTKTASGSPVRAGDQLSYTFTVTNTGNRPLTGVGVTDPQLLPATVSCAAGSLAVGASTTCTASAPYVLTQADVEAGRVTNTATVVATPPNGEGAAGSVSDTDDHTATIARTPRLRIAKTASGNPFVAGDQISYGFTVTNTGNVVVTGVGVADALVTGESCIPTTLSPGQSATCTANPYLVSAADVAAGQVVNTATPTGTTVSGAPSVDPASTPSVTTRLGTLPTATVDTRATAQNVPVTLNPLTNDAAGATGTGTAGSLLPGSVVFTSAAATDAGKTLVVAGQGSYTINPTTGVVAFTPVPAFTGAAASVGYAVTDSLGHTATSTITITVDPIVPDAVDDTTTTPYLTPVTVPALGNDAAGAVSAPLVPGSVAFTAPGATNAGRTLLVAGQGIWTLDPASGAVTFTPSTGFAGAATPVEYQVADTNGTTDTARVRVTVVAPPAPAAAPDTATTLQNVVVQLAPAANDSAFGGASLDATSVVFTSVSATDAGRTLVVPGEGAWTIDPATGTTSFDPEPGFTGATTAVGYRVADNLGRTATSTQQVTVTPVQPVATDDLASTPYLTGVDLPAPANDAAGDPSAPLLPGSLVLTSPAATGAGRALVTSEGTWTVRPDGTVGFVPAAGFSGPTTPVGYAISDANGTTATATLVVVVGTPPAATDDTGTTLQNTPVILEPLRNDAAGSGGTLQPTSIRFADPAATAGGTVLVVAGEGTWVLDPMTGLATFTPLPDFTGTTTGVRYDVVDSHGNPATATITITVTPVTPAATDDTAATPFRTPVATAVLANDIAGDASAPLLPGSVQLTGPATTDAGRTLLVPGEGRYQVGADGSITFTPEPAFTGAATPVGYRVLDANGTTAVARLAVTVGAPPVANPDVDATPQDVPVTVGLLANDTPGTDGAGTAGTLVPASVTFTAPAATDGGRRLVVPGEGVWTIDPATGTAVFDPDPAFTGPATPVAYAVSDSFGQSVTSTVTVTVTAVVPAAAADAEHTLHGTPVTVDVLANDTPGAASAPLVPGSVVITTPGATDAGRTLVVPGQGRWTVEAAGELRFAPVPGFVGPASVAYQVLDTNGTPATANLVVTVGAAPAALDDATTTPQNVTVELSPLANDSTGDDGNGTVGTLEVDTVRFTAAAATDGGRTLVVPGEGTWTVEPSGRVSFDPEPAFTGPSTPVGYAVSDSLGQSATADLRVSVTPVTPAAVDDRATTAYRSPVSIDVLANDTAGAASAPLARGSVVLTSPDATDAGRTLVVPGQGTWAVQPDGSVTFTPATGFAGTAGPVGYRVADTNQTTTTALLQVGVGLPPVPLVADDARHTPYLTPVTTTVLANDAAGGLATLEAGSVRLTDPAAVNGATTLVVAGEGTVQVNPGGTITFTPVAGFTGPATAVEYRVLDELGQSGTARLVVTVGEPPAAADDSTTTPQGVAVTLSPLGNDAGGDDGAGTRGALVPSSVGFTSASATDSGHSLVLAGEGIWTIQPVSGAATFAPLPGFTGTTTGAAYAVSDSFGNVATAVLTVTVTPVVPVATDDTGATPFRTPVTTAVLANDTAGATSAPLAPGSVTFASGAATDAGRTLVVAGEGTYRAADDGRITFTPLDDFSGPATPVTYRVLDANATAATAELAITVGAPPRAIDDTVATPHDTAVTLHPLGNDAAGDDGTGTAGTLEVATLAFTAADATDGGHRLEVAGQGTWVLQASGTVVFDPEPGFAGPTASVGYAVTDSLGTTAVALLTVTVGAPPAAADDATTTRQNVTVELDPLGNDTAGDDGAGATGTLVAASVVFTSADATDAGRTLVVSGEGTWTIDPATGRAGFDPEPGFAGVATPVRYAVSDSFGTTAFARLRVTVTPVAPEVADDSRAGAYNQPLTIDVLGNDVPGDVAAPLDPSSLVFTGPGASDGGRRLVVPGEGTWVVNPDGTVTFTPEDGWTGTSTPVAYAIADANGAFASGTVTAVIGAGPAASDDQVEGAEPGEPVVIDVLGNDSGAAGCTLEPASLVIVAGDPAGPVATWVVPGEGTWTANPDGTLLFTPDAGFSGWTSWVTYGITDGCGNPVTGQSRAFVPAGAVDGVEDGGDDGDPDGSLAYTGAAVGGALGLGLLALAGGGLLLAVRRRRES